MAWWGKKGKKSKNENIPGSFCNIRERLRVGAGLAESPWWTPRCAFIIHTVWRISSSSTPGPVFFIFFLPPS